MYVPVGQVAVLEELRRLLAPAVPRLTAIIGFGPDLAGTSP